MIPKPLFRTTIVIWSKFDPSDLELVALAQEATDGLAFCSKQHTVSVRDPRRAAKKGGFADFFALDEKS